MSLQNGTLVVADDPLIKAVNYALTLKYNEEQPGASRRRRSSVNDAGLGAAESSEYGGMLHLGVEKETIGEGESATEKVYLTVDWPESGSSDETLVGIYRNKEIHYTAKSIQLTEDINIYVDIYRLKIIAANPSRQTIGSYWSLIGQYSKNAGTVSQLLRDDRAGSMLMYDIYTGMLHAFLDVEVTTDSSGNITSETLYLNVDWPESGSSDQTLVGNFNNTPIYWTERQAIPEGGAMIAFDPHTREILLVKAGDVFVSNWKVIATYNATLKSVTQNWRNDRLGDGLLFDGYDGNFVMAYDRGSGTIQILPSIYGQNTVIGTTIAGNVSVNNTNYRVPSYSVAAATSYTFFYIRHQVAQSASSGDEDPDLTEEQKEALRTTIANCDTAITTANQAINQYLQQITALQTELAVAYKAISNAYGTRDSALTTERNRHTTAVNAENADYEQKVASENQLHADNLAQLDPTASDYQSKVAAENTRHNTELQQLLTDHNAEIAAENTTNTTNINTINAALNTALSEQNTIISGLNSQIATLRGNIRTQQQTISEQTQTKNEACLQLYGVIPSSAGAEIIGLPNTQGTAQTDQYLFIYIGHVSRATETVSSVSVDRITINQAYLGSIMAFYRMDTTCGGLLS